MVQICKNFAFSFLRINLYIYIVIIVNSVQARTPGRYHGDTDSSEILPVTHETPTIRAARQLAHIFRAPYISSPKKFKPQPYKIVSKRKKYSKGPMPPFPGKNTNTLNNKDNPVLVMRQRRPPPKMTTTSQSATALLQFLPRDSVSKPNGNNFDTKYKKLIKKDPRYEEYVKVVQKHLHKQWAKTSTTTTKRPIIRLRTKSRTSQQKRKNSQIRQKFVSSSEEDDDDDDDVDENEQRDDGISSESVEDNYDTHLEKKDNLLQYNDQKQKTKKNYSLAFSIGGTNFRFSMAPHIFGR